jgi:hypothetical protein
MSRELFEALASASAPPCTGYACPKQRDCATQKLACESFLHYVNSGRAVHPLMLFKKNNNGWRALNMLKHEHNPTRALYDRIFKPEENNDT